MQQATFTLFWLFCHLCLLKDLFYPKGGITYLFWSIKADKHEEVLKIMYMYMDHFCLFTFVLVLIMISYKINRYLIVQCMIIGSLWKKRWRYLYNIKTILQLSCSKNVKYLFYNICYFLSQQGSCMFIGVRDFNPFPLPLPPRLPGTSWPRIVDYLGDPQTLAIYPPPPIPHLAKTMANTHKWDPWSATVVSLYICTF